MVQLQILTGRKAGTTVPVTNLPCQIGRGGSASLTFDDPGVWEKHLELALVGAEGFFLTLHTPALATVNGQPFERVLLRNGDLVEAGEVKLRFWLTPTRQASLRLREVITWLALVALCALQLLIIYALVA